MEELDYWRLCDELNVVQAALLIVGEAPNMAAYTENKDIDKRPTGYEAAKSAIVGALKRYKACQDDGSVFDLASDAPSLFSRFIIGNLVPHYDSDMNGNTLGPIEGSVDVWCSTVEVDSLKRWLRGRGFTTGFFFPEGTSDTPDYLDPQHPRYAPKLAAAVCAWQAVTDPGKTSAKKALDKWLREHAAQFDLTDDEGNPVNQAIEECSKVANWNQKGGAPSTPGT